MTRTASVAALALATLPAAYWGAPLLLGPAEAQDAAAEAPAEAAPEAAAEAATQAATEAATEAPGTEDAAASAEAAPVAIPDMTVGAEDAPIEVIEYGSFTCPHCANWHAESWPELKRDWIDTGRVRFTFREVYFDRYGLWASMVARCGGEMRFFGIHDMIYEQQREWIGDQEPATIADNLKRLGVSAGLDQAQVDACLADQAEAEALVAWFQGNATADGIDSTPTFLVNGEKYTNMAWSDFEALLEEQMPAEQ